MYRNLFFYMNYFRTKLLPKKKEINFEKKT